MGRKSSEFFDRPKARIRHKLGRCGTLPPIGNDASHANAGAPATDRLNVCCFQCESRGSGIGVNRAVMAPSDGRAGHAQRPKHSESRDPTWSRCQPCRSRAREDNSPSRCCRNSSQKVWAYGSTTDDSSFHSPPCTIKAARGTPIELTWINELKDENRHYLPHLLPIDPTLHWANPLGSRDMRKMFAGTPG